MILMNRRGGERVLSFYWFIMFVIIAIGVVSGVFIFFSDQIDVRELEAEILGDRVIRCFVEDGKLKEEVLDEVNEANFEERCGLIFEDNTHLDYRDENQYFVEVSFDGKSMKIDGNDESKFKAFCGQEESKVNIPICADKKLMVLDEKEESFVVMYVLVGIDKVEQNALA